MGWLLTRSRLISKSSALGAEAVNIQLSVSLSYLLLVLSTVWNAALCHQHHPTLVVHASTTATGATIIALPVSPPHSYPRHARHTLSPITTPTQNYTQSSRHRHPFLKEAIQVQMILWPPPLPLHPCAICVIPCQTSYTSMAPASHHPPLPVPSTAHAHALSPSRPSYPPTLGSTRNVIASSAHAVEHPLWLLFYEPAAAITTSHRVHHTSPASGVMVVRRLNSRPSGLIGNSCSASSAFFVRTGRILGIMLRRGRLMNCIIEMWRSARGGNGRGGGWRGCALDRNCPTLMRIHVRVSLSRRFEGLTWADGLVVCRYIWSPIKRECAPRTCNCHSRWIQARPATRRLPMRRRVVPYG
jgi:hypothetical protein